MLFHIGVCNAIAPLCTKIILFVGFCLLNVFGVFIKESMSDSTEQGNLAATISSSICRYCLCDQQSSSVICSSGRNLRFNVISLPSWVETFYVYNLSMPALPHFSYNIKLRSIAINNCGLSELHPLGLLPLPNLESIDFSGNAISGLPENLLERSKRLRKVNLARNNIQDIGALQWRLPKDLILEELNLSENPLCGSTFGNAKFEWPSTQRLNLRNANIQQINATHITFEGVCNGISHKTLSIPEHIWETLESLDLSNNPKLTILPSAFEKLSNLVTLILQRVAINHNFLEWLKTPSTRLRRLDLSNSHIVADENVDETFRMPFSAERLMHIYAAHGANHHTKDSSSNSKLVSWNNYCGSELEWLDISGMGLERLELDLECGIKWLHAENNRLSSIKLYRRQNGNALLKTLRLDNNLLSQWPLTPTNEETNFFHNAPHYNSSDAFAALEILSVANNSLTGAILTNMLAALPSLVHLDLSNNRLNEIYAPAGNSSSIPISTYESDEDRVLRASNQNGFELITVNPHLEFLNVSGNRLHNVGESRWPILLSVAVLDASSNALDNVDALEIFRKMPSLQHLHLAHNQRIGLQNLPLMLPSIHLGTTIESEINALASNLVEIDLMDCALRKMPVLSMFSRLSAIGLSGNLLSVIDAQLLPRCAVALDAGMNRIEKVINFSDEQLSCLRHFDLSQNPLHCKCAIQAYAPILQRQDSFYDRTEYYCFSMDGWQHPLSAFIETSAELCRRHTYSDSDDIDNGFSLVNPASRFATNFMRFTGLLLLFIAIIILCFVALIKICRLVIATKFFSPISYKLILQNDTPVHL